MTFAKEVSPSLSRVSGRLGFDIASSHIVIVLIELKDIDGIGEIHALKPPI